MDTYGSFFRAALTGLLASGQSPMDMENKYSQDLLVKIAAQIAKKAVDSYCCHVVEEVQNDNVT
jgi:hypothetical protein